MGFYVEIRPNDSKPLTIAEFRQRFLDAGLELHPALTHPDSPPEDRVRYADDLMYSRGNISFYHNAKLPCAVTADARISWGEREAEVKRIFQELLDIARNVDSALFFSNHDGTFLISEDALDRAVADFTKVSRIALGSFGTIKDADDPH